MHIDNAEEVDLFDRISFTLKSNLNFQLEIQIWNIIYIHYIYFLFSRIRNKWQD